MIQLPANVIRYLPGPNSCHRLVGEHHHPSVQWLATAYALTDSNFGVGIMPSFAYIHVKFSSPLANHTTIVPPPIILWIQDHSSTVLVAAAFLRDDWLHLPACPYRFIVI
jgi:hypothetical protein